MALRVGAQRAYINIYMDFNVKIWKLVSSFWLPSLGLMSLSIVHRNCRIQFQLVDFFYGIQKIYDWKSNFGEIYWRFSKLIHQLLLIYLRQNVDETNFIIFKWQGSANFTPPLSVERIVVK